MCSAAEVTGTSACEVATAVAAAERPSSIPASGLAFCGGSMSLTVSLAGSCRLPLSGELELSDTEISSSSSKTTCPSVHFFTSGMQPHGASGSVDVTSLSRKALVSTWRRFGLGSSTDSNKARWVSGAAASRDEAGPAATSGCWCASTPVNVVAVGSAFCGGIARLKGPTAGL